MASQDQLQQEEKNHSEGERHPLSTTMNGGSSSMPPPPMALGAGAGAESTFQLTAAPVGAAPIQRVIDDASINLDQLDFARAVVGAFGLDSIERDELAELKEKGREIQQDPIEDERVRHLITELGRVSIQGFGARKPRVLELATSVKEGYFRGQATDMETNDRAHPNINNPHSLDRHGPEISDHALKTRLTTGTAPDGVYSPAPGLSTKFIDHETWVRTRLDAMMALNDALENTIDTLAPYLDDFIIARDNYDNSPVGPGRAVGQPLHTARANARAILEYQIQKTRDDAPQNDVVPLNPNLGAAAPADMIQFRQSYTVVINHGRTVGTGFSGNNPNVADPATYANTAAVAPIEQTRTGLEPNVAPVSIMDPGFDPSVLTYSAFQHFPSGEPEAGIRI